jgi:uncharacterized membrane protein YvlD (DUF360 family)
MVAAKALPAYYPYLTLLVFQVAVVLLSIGFIDTVCGHAQDSLIEGIGSAIFFAIFLSCFNDLQRERDR